MERFRAFLQQNRRAVIGLVVLAVLAGFWLGTRILGGTPETAAPPTTPPPAAAPTPAPPSPEQPPAAEQPPSAEQQPEATAPPGVVPTGPVGRPDPFIPLVSEATAGAPAPGPAAGSPPPPLPPPPFPGAPGTPGTPGAPAAPGAEAPPPPPPPEAGVVLLGIIGDSRSVVIVSVDGKTDILFEGESSGNVRVVKIDAVRGVVTFERDGERFELTMGGE